MFPNLEFLYIKFYENLEVLSCYRRTDKYGESDGHISPSFIAKSSEIKETL
jgi:hypothetical protein